MSEKPSLKLQRELRLVPDTLKLVRSTQIKIDHMDILVVTQLVYPGQPKAHYDTMAYGECEGVEFNWRQKYNDIEEARKGHAELLKYLERGEYEIVPIRWKLRIRQRCKLCKQPKPELSDHNYICDECMLGMTARIESIGEDNDESGGE